MQKKINAWLRKWEDRGYSSGIPDEVDARLELMGKIPSYRLVCIALMKNDHALQLLGHQRPPCEAYNSIKRAELLAKGKIQPDKQRSLL